MFLLRARHTADPGGHDKAVQDLRHLVQSALWCMAFGLFKPGKRRAYNFKTLDLTGIDHGASLMPRAAVTSSPRVSDHGGHTNGTRF